MNDPIRNLVQALKNLDRRIRKLENRELLPPTEQPVTFAGAWVNVGAPYANVTYWRDANNIVFVRGRASGGSVPSTLFTLPAGYRPSHTMSFTTSLGDVIEVAVTGVVTVASGASPVSLDGIIFRASA